MLIGLINTKLFQQLNYFVVLPIRLKKSLNIMKINSNQPKSQEYHNFKKESKLLFIAHKYFTLR